LEYINIGKSNATFHLFHGECEDYRREFVLPLEEILNDKGIIDVYLDFGRLSYVTEKEAQAIERLKSTLSLLDLNTKDENMRPSVSLALSRWGNP
tara:strand:- start:251100 stop:251384 length:285 start_codon:yes stop_codon:yes gene_type:complete